MFAVDSLRGCFARFYKSVFSNLLIMSEVINPPEYYFTGINFNPAFYAEVKAVQELKEDYDSKLSKLEARLHALESK